MSWSFVFRHNDNSNATTYSGDENGIVHPRITRPHAAVLTQHQWPGPAIDGGTSISVRARPQLPCAGYFALPFLHVASPDKSHP
jgi:hypothetical protein